MKEIDSLKYLSVDNRYVPKKVFVVFVDRNNEELKNGLNVLQKMFDYRFDIACFFKLIY